MGLTGIVETDCSDVDSILFHSGVRWSAFVNPALLLTLYWMMAINKQYVKYRSKVSRKFFILNKEISTTVILFFLKKVYACTLVYGVWMCIV